MWLLDANMDVQPVAAAIANGFDCLLTRDRLFGESASRALQLHPTFAVILVNLPQQRWPEYRQSFLKAWASFAMAPNEDASSSGRRSSPPSVKLSRD